MSRDSPSVLVVSHLYPSARHPYLGIFVARQAQALRETHHMRVLAPTRWVPPLTKSWRNERLLARRELLDGMPVSRPRLPHLPFGGMTAEALVSPLALRRETRRLQRERAIDLVHAHFGVPDGWVGARLGRDLRVPLIVSLWGSDVLVHPGKWSLRGLLSHALRRASHVIAPSRFVADRALELGADPDRTSVVMGGVPDDYSLSSRHSARVALGLPQDTRLAVWVGSLVSVKRPELALYAMSRVARRDPDIRLAVIGDGPLRPAVVEIIRELRLGSVVSVLGALSSTAVASWQTAADVVVSTSASEGLSFALSEALVSGTRVAAVPVGGIPELLAATAGGTLAEDSSPEAVAAAIEHELGLPPDRELARRSAFLLQSNIAPQLADIYARVL